MSKIGKKITVTNDKKLIKKKHYKYLGKEGIIVEESRKYNSSWWVRIDTDFLDLHDQSFQQIRDEVDADVVKNSYKSESGMVDLMKVNKLGSSITVTTDKKLLHDQHHSYMGMKGTIVDRSPKYNSSWLVKVDDDILDLHDQSFEHVETDRNIKDYYNEN